MEKDPHCVRFGNSLPHYLPPPPPPLHATDDVGIVQALEEMVEERLDGSGAVAHLFERMDGTDFVKGAVLVCLRVLDQHALPLVQTLTVWRARVSICVWKKTVGCKEGVISAHTNHKHKSHSPVAFPKHPSPK